MSDEIEVGSQTETMEDVQQTDAETEALYSSFGVKPAVEQKEIEFPDVNQSDESLETEDTPAIVDQPESSKKLTVKHNKQDVEVDISTDEKLTDHLQRSLALDKVRDQAKQHQTDLDRAAKLLGYKDHAELSANFDNIEKANQQKQVDQFEAMKEKVINDLVDAGIDEQTAIEYANNNPLVQQAKIAIEAQQQQSQLNQAEVAKQALVSRWKELFTEFPHLEESGHGDEAPKWLTPEMDAMLKKNYDPIDAYRLSHADEIKALEKKKTEQKIIKQQQLGQRGHAEGQAPAADQVTLSAAQMALAEEFGVSTKEVERQQQLLKNRR